MFEWLLTLEFCSVYNYQKQPQKKKFTKSKLNMSNEVFIYVHVNNPNAFYTSMACHYIGNFTHKVIMYILSRCAIIV